MIDRSAVNALANELWALGIRGHLEWNPHRDMYQTIPEWIETQKALDSTTILNEEQILEDDTLWVLYWNPKTLVGSYSLAAASLVDLIDEIRTGDYR